MKKVVALLFFGAFLVGLGIFTGFFANNPGVVIGLAVVCVFVVLLVGIVAGSLYSSWLMKKGAELVTEDRKATAAVSAGYFGFAREMVRHLGQSGGKNAPPALPLPSQDTGAWLPDLQEFEEALKRAELIYKEAVEKGDFDLQKRLLENINKIKQEEEPIQNLISGICEMSD